MYIIWFLLKSWDDKLYCFIKIINMNMQNCKHKALAFTPGLKRPLKTWSKGADR